MYNITKLKQALEDLKEACKSFDNDCSGCPLCDSDGDCQLSQESPDSWEIKEQLMILL